MLVQRRHLDIGAEADHAAVPGGLAPVSNPRINVVLPAPFPDRQWPIAVAALDADREVRRRNNCGRHRSGWMFLASITSFAGFVGFGGGEVGISRAAAAINRAAARAQA